MAPLMPTEPSSVVTVTDWVVRLAASDPNSSRSTGATQHHVDGAPSLRQPVGQHEHRRGAVPVADQRARDGLLRQRERPTQRAQHAHGVVRLQSGRAIGSPGCAP